MSTWAWQEHFDIGSPPDDGFDFQTDHLPQIILLLVRQWLEADRPSLPVSRSRTLSRASIPSQTSESAARVAKRHSYQVINSEFFSTFDCGGQYGSLDLLRVTRRGFMVKDRVDAAIDQCALVWNLRDSIEEERARAVDSTDERRKRMHAQIGAWRICRFTIFLDPSIE